MEKNFREEATIEGNLVTASRGRDVRTLLVTSCSPGEGKTVAAISLAVTLARMPDRRILLVEGNLRGPKIASLLGLEAEPGLSDLISRRVPIEGVLQSTQWKNLQVITQGSPMDNPLSVFRTQEFPGWIKGFRDGTTSVPAFDYVIFDTPFYLGPSDTSIMACHFDGVLLVVQGEKTKWVVAQMVRDRLKGVGGNPLGVILNRRKFYIPQWFYRFI
ncbi:MAG: CpsD/CapB family tyrosine-protein kinase [Magnetococcales bacterium]|nr:CpsD/CapB family tyrosine-protein kinase [Magnetococcales bacterium]